MIDAQQFAQLAAEGRWLLALSMLVGFLVRILKDDNAVRWFPATIPAAWRAPVALALGVVMATLRLAGNGMAWWPAILAGVAEGLTAGSSAVAGHQVLIESLRGGREFGMSREDHAARTFGNPTPRS